MNGILEYTIGRNTIQDYAIALAVMAGGMLISRIIRTVVAKKLARRAAKTASTWDDFLHEVLKKSVVPALYICSLYFALNYLALPGKAEKIIHVAFLAAITFFIIRIISATFKKFVHDFVSRQSNNEAKRKQASGLVIIVNGLIWILGIVFLIDNLGYDVTTLVAGLGIGGIAIALAAQTILGDLFSYFVIFFDRPFEIGDFIVLDDKSGVIENIGIKTTRIRTLGGEQLICSNTDLTNARVHNYKRMQKRRVVFELHVDRNTPYQQLAAIPTMVKELISGMPLLEFDRGHLAGHGPYSMKYEFVYYVASPDYNVYMDNQQSVYLGIARLFGEQKIQLAYPTQKLWMPNPELAFNNVANNN